MKTKQFQKFTDLGLVWDFLVEVYEYGKDRGVSAPFFEHAIKASWMDASYSYLDRFWFDGDKVVAFVFYEDPVTGALIDPEKAETIAEAVEQKYLTSFPEMRGKYSFHLCDSADGVRL